MRWPELHSDRVAELPKLLLTSLQGPHAPQSKLKRTHCAATALDPWRRPNVLSQWLPSRRVPVSARLCWSCVAQSLDWRAPQVCLAHSLAAGGELRPRLSVAHQMGEPVIARVCVLASCGASWLLRHARSQANLHFGPDEAERESTDSTTNMLGVSGKQAHTEPHEPHH